MGRWNGVGTEATAEQPATLELHLWRDGAWRATLRLAVDGRLRVQTAGEPPSAAQLPADSAGLLQRGPGDSSAAPR